MFPFDEDTEETPSPNPYAPRSDSYLKGLKAGLDGEDLSMPTAQEIEDAEGDPVKIDNLIARAQAAQATIDGTRNKSYLIDAGNGYVAANPLGAIADIFVRGNAKKERDEANMSAEQISKSQRAAAAKLKSREGSRSRADYVNEQLRDIGELNRGDAQKELTEKTRQRERGEDISHRSARETVADAWNKSEAARDSHQFHDNLELGYARLGADKDSSKQAEKAADQKEIMRQFDTSVDIANKGIAEAGTDGGPVTGRLGAGFFGGRSEFEGSVSGLSNAVRSQIRQHFKDASQSNVELQAFERQLPLWTDTKEVRQKKLENIVQIYSPSALQQRSQGPGPGRSPTGSGGYQPGSFDPFEAERKRRGL
jgi:hypothetical protein